MTDIDKMMKTARELDPEIWEKVDEIAKIIDPAAYPNWETMAGNFDRERIEKRMNYYQAMAEHKAYQILQLLDIAPNTYDWVRLFDAIKEE